LSANIENVGVNTAKLTLAIPPETLEAAADKVFQRNRGRFSVPGFRPGKAPRKFVERFYGAGILREEAAEESARKALYDFLENAELDVISYSDVKIGETVSDGELPVTVTLYLRPDVSIVDYKGLKYPKHPADVSDEDIAAAIDRDREENARVVSVDDRPARLGDKAVIDFEGFVYNTAFPGGKAEDYSIKLGSGTFIAGFEDQIVGHEIGDSFDILVKFPDDYGKGGPSEDLAGKPARFETRLKALSYDELPEPDDDFARDISEFDTFAEYRDSVRARLQKDKDDHAREHTERRLMRTLVEKTQFEVPPDMVMRQAESEDESFRGRLANQGMTPEMFYKSTGTSEETVRRARIGDAYERVKSAFILSLIAEAEGIGVTDEELSDHLDELAAANGMTRKRVEEGLKEDDYDAIRDMLKNRKAMDAVLSCAEETDEILGDEDSDGHDHGEEENE
jgi:trigger factor